MDLGDNRGVMGRTFVTTGQRHDGNVAVLIGGIGGLAR